MQLYSTKSNAQRSAKRRNLQNYEITPKEGKFAIIVNKPAAIIEKPTRKIEKNRPESNGYKWPSKGTTCHVIWAYCQSRLDNDGVIPKPKEMKKFANDNNINPTTSVLQLYYWRNFQGIKGHHQQ